MNFYELAKKRYSVRTYTDEKVSEEDLKLILEAGRVAPTGTNAQPQRLFVAQTEEALAKINKGGRTFGAPMAIIVCADKEEAWVRSADGKNIADIDASIVTDHMMLQATELGLGTLWMCAFKPAIIREEFQLPENLVPVNILLIGHKDESTKTPAMSSERHTQLRKPLSETVTFL